MKYIRTWVTDMKGHKHPAEAWQVDDAFGATIRPTLPIKARWMVATFRMDLEDRRVLAHGFQSWTGCIMADKSTLMPRLNPIAAHIFKLKYYGDYHFCPYPNKRGVIHSHEYLRVFEGDREVFFAGNLRPELGYGIFEVDFNRNEVTYRVDIEGLTLQPEEPFNGISLYFGTSAGYFSRRGLDASHLSNLYGWTSWYYHYTRITEGIILDNLKALTEADLDLDVFQIDDGFQQSVGDWLICNDKFPNGMKPIARSVKDKGLTPGLWLAPFGCERGSDLFRDHNDYLLRDAKGKLQTVGYNPTWSGMYYTLDIYNDGARDYLRRVFDTVVNDWGFEFLKLDFLYCVAILPREGKTRAMVMHDALSFIREIRGDALLLGCGCPIGVAAGMVEYMRIGSDVSLMWEDGLLSFANYRERVSTANSLQSTVNRAFLNGRAFLNDPDVFILRSTADIRMSYDQRMELVDKNFKHGSLVFFSDDIREYTDEEMAILRRYLSTAKQKERAQ